MVVVVVVVEEVGDGEIFLMSHQSWDFENPRDIVGLNLLSSASPEILPC